VGSAGWISYGYLKRAYLNITVNVQVPYKSVTRLLGQRLSAYVEVICSKTMETFKQVRIWDSILN